MLAYLDFCTFRLVRVIEVEVHVSNHSQNMVPRDTLVYNNESALFRVPASCEFLVATVNCTLLLANWICQGVD